MDLIRRKPNARFALVSSLLLGIALGILVLDHFQRVSTLSIWLATAAIAVGIARMALTYAKHLHMLDNSQQEAFTDALTGLGNRRRLLSDLEKVLGSRDAGDTHVLALFDLNGFKSYNDSF